MNNQPGNTIDIELVAARRKHQWIRENSGRRSLLDWLDISIPWWVLLIGLAAFVLSAQHTVSVFSQITPVAGVAPVLVEFTLLWGAFSRVKARTRGTSVPKFTHIMEILAFCVSVIVNFVGAVTFVQQRPGSGITDLSIASVLLQFGTLSFLTQAGLCISPLFALFIPGSAVLGGEGIAAQIAEYRSTGGTVEERWREAQLVEITQACYAELVRNGTPDAKREAWKLATGYLNLNSRVSVIGSADTVKALPEGAKVSSAKSPRTAQGRNTDSRQRVREYLTDNPSQVSASVRELALIVGVSKTIAAEELAKFKQRPLPGVDGK